MLRSRLSILLIGFAASLFFTSGASAHTNAPYSGRSIYELPSGGNAENLAIRANGQILLTGSGTPDLLEIDGTRTQSAQVIHTFPNVLGLNGIVEVEPDVFAVGSGNQSGLPDVAGTQGSWTVWTVDFTSSPVQVKKVVDVPDAVLLDGFTTVPGSGIVFAADSQGGAIYRIDVSKRMVTRALQDDALAGTNSSVQAGIDHLGVNGLKVGYQSLYFTNTAKQFLGRFSLNETSAEITGPPSILYNLGVQIDDFLVLSEESFLVAENLHGIAHVSLGDGYSTGSSELLVSYNHTNACAFGRRQEDSCILYAPYQGVNTSGLISADLAGSRIVPGC